MSKPTPGWNDPPPLAYNAGIPQQQVMAPRRNFLNKRVGFALSTPGSLTLTTSTVGITSATSTTSSPGPPLCSLLPSYGSAPDHSSVSTDSNSGDMLIPQHLEPINLSSNEMRTHTLTTLRNLLEKREKKEEDLARRLEHLNYCWEEGKLNQDIEQKMYRLSKELETGNCDEAYRLHQSLIVDHVSMVTSWIVAVKHVILIAKSHQQQSGSSDSNFGAGGDGTVSEQELELVEKEMRNLSTDQSDHNSEQ